MVISFFKMIYLRFTKGYFVTVTAQKYDVKYKVDFKVNSLVHEWLTGLTHCMHSVHNSHCIQCCSVFFVPHNMCPQTLRASAQLDPPPENETSRRRRQRTFGIVQRLWRRNRTRAPTKILDDTLEGTDIVTEEEKVAFWQATFGTNWESDQRPVAGRQANLNAPDMGAFKLVLVRNDSINGIVMTMKILVRKQ